MATLLRNPNALPDFEARTHKRVREGFENENIENSDEENQKIMKGKLYYIPW
ncbi:hypothetical protein C349_04687, partial [Cryptococcus neoformans var. grubii Br795]